MMAMNGVVKMKNAGLIFRHWVVRILAKPTGKLCYNSVLQNNLRKFQLKSPILGIFIYLISGICYVLFTKNDYYCGTYYFKSCQLNYHPVALFV